MSGQSGLAAPGSSTYNSPTMHVGDGTWDASRDDFLLPNLMGLNFDTMRYNGMGNRFASLEEYHTLIRGHGVIAAITFLGIVPLAIFTVRFGPYFLINPRNALRFHLWLQILTLLLATIVFILGFIAVGPDRKLTNPHHGIGVAIYVLLWFQLLFGWWIRRRERKRKIMPTIIPLKLMLHKWLGRAIALLGITQVPLGLTLYGSPKSLFVLYAVAVFCLIVLWFILTREKYRRDTTALMYSDDGSYVGGAPPHLAGSHLSQPQQRTSGGHFWRDAAFVGGGIAAYEAWKNRRRDRIAARDDARMTGHRPGSAIVPYSAGVPSAIPGPRVSAIPRRTDEVIGSRPQSVMDEEMSEKYRPERPNHTWRDRILAGAGGFAAAEGMRSWWDRRKARRAEDVEDSYRPPLGGATSFNAGGVGRPGRPGLGADELDPVPHVPAGSALSGVSAVTPTRPPPGVYTGSTPRRQHHGRADSIDTWERSDDEESYNVGYAPGRRPGPTPERQGFMGRAHALRDGVAGGLAGAAVGGGLGGWWKRRKDAKEQRRVDEMREQDRVEQERINRAASRRHAGSGVEAAAVDEAVHATGSTGRRAGGRRGSNTASEFTEERMAESLGGSHPALSRTRLNGAAAAAAAPYPTEPGLTMGPDGLPGPPAGHIPSTYPAANLPGPPPGPPPLPSEVAGSAPYPRESQQLDEHGHPILDAAGGALAGAAGVAAIDAMRDRRHSRSGSAHRNTSDVDGTQSPPVSVKVKMHKDGRHVTLRRLNEQEASADRERRRLERRNRQGSFSSNSNTMPGPGYRRADLGAPAAAAGGVAGHSQASLPIPAVPAGAIHHSATPPLPGSAHISPPPPTGSAAMHSVSNLAPSMHSNLTATPHSATGSGAPAPGSSPYGAAAPSGVGYATETTDASGFDSNRRRRRAERARAKAAALAGSGSNISGQQRVGFT